jgi:hypothetical protein
MVSQEERLLALETQIQGLLEWKNMFQSFLDPELVRKNEVVSTSSPADGGKLSRTAKNKLAKMAAAALAETAAAAAAGGREGDSTQLLMPTRVAKKGEDPMKSKVS